VLFNTQLLYLNYFGNIISGTPIQTKRIKMHRMIISEGLNLKLNRNATINSKLKLYVQMFKGQNIIYNSLNTDLVEN